MLNPQSDWILDFLITEEDSNLKQRWIPMLITTIKGRYIWIVVVLSFDF